MSLQVIRGENFVATNAAVLQMAAKQTGLQPTLVLVPDRFTLQAERQMLATNAALINTRVVTFSMLYQMVASEITQGQIPADQVLDKTSAILCLWRAIRKVQKQLTWFQRQAGTYDFAAKMFNTLNQMASSRVDFAALADQAKYPVSKQKYHDINLIYQAYHEMLGTRTDSSGMLDYLLNEIPHSAALKDTAVFVCGFTVLSPARLDVLKMLGKHAAAVTVAASELEITRQLMTYPFTKLATKNTHPRQVTARCLTTRGEALVVSQEIVKLLNAGVAPDNIVVLLNDFDTVAPVWQEVCTAQKNPVNLDIGQKLSATAEAKYLRDLLAALQNDHAENTLAVLANQCSGINDQQFYDLENAIVKGNLRGSSLPEIPQLKKPRSLAQLCETLATLTTQPKLQNLLTVLAQNFRADSELSKLSLREFSNLFWTLCTATKVSQIPTYLQHVLIAPVNEWVPTAVDYLFIANCTVNNYPAGQSDDDILQTPDLQGTRITPTPQIQRERNYQLTLLLEKTPRQQIYLSGLKDEFAAAPVIRSKQFQIPELKYQLDAQLARVLFVPNQTVKTTMLERFYSCPYANFIDNGLKLAPREIYQLRVSDVGSAIHKALEVYYRRHDLDAAVTAGLALLTYDQAPLKNSVQRAIKNVIQELDAAFANGAFRVQDVEVKISQPLKSGLTLVGKVDRVDVATDAAGHKMLAVYDYKTGKVPDNLLKHIALGDKLQLPVYTAALKGTATVAGMGYLPISSGYRAADDTLELKGFVAKDLKDAFAPQLLNPKAHIYITPAQMAQLMQHAAALVDDAVARILAGDIKPVAIEKGVCEYCRVAAFCPHYQTDCRFDTTDKVTWDDFGGAHE